MIVSSFGFEPIKVGDIILSDKTYKNAVILAKESDGVKIIHDGGPARIKYELLPTVLPNDVVKKIGSFDLNEAQKERLRKQHQANQLDALVIPRPNSSTRTVEQIVEYNKTIDSHISILKERESYILSEISKVPTVSVERNKLLKQLDQTRLSITRLFSSKLSLPITKEEIENIKK